MRMAALGSESFHLWFRGELSDLAEAVAAELGSNLIALTLGGGYGRGEGAVVWREGLERPYNDLDLFLVVRSPRNLSGLEQISRQFEHRLGVDVDFSRPLTPRKVATLPHTLMWHDLMRGHLVLWGDPEYLKSRTPGYLLDPPPAGEATRLLLNRGVGLLWAERVQNGLEKAPDADFVRRNVFKAVLALGDSHFLEQRHIVPCLESRASALRGLGAGQALVELYEAAIAFKRLPGQVPTPDLERVLQLWEERFTHLQAAGIVDPEIRRKDQRLRNLARNIRAGRLSFEHPRSLLYSGLPSVRLAPSRWSQLFRIWSRYH